MLEKLVYPVIPYAVALLISGSLALLILVLAWPRRLAPGGQPLIWMMVAIMVWCWTYALHWLSGSHSARFFWLNATYFGAVSFPIFLLVFVAQITRQDGWLRGRNFYLLWIVPGITLLAMWTDPLHSLFSGRQPGAEASNFLSGGPLFWMSIVYSYLLVLAAYGLAVIGFFRLRGTIYRWQIATVLTGMLIGMVVLVLELRGFIFLPGLDLTPITFTLISPFLLSSLVGFQMLKVIPVSLDAVIDQMQDGVLVINSENKIIEVNRSAAGLVNSRRNELVGKPLDVFGNVLPDLKGELVTQLHRSQVHLTVPTPMDLEIQVHPLIGRRGGYRGTLITLRDITHIKAVEGELRRINTVLTLQLEQIAQLQQSLQEQVIRDPLTGLFNRRYLDESLPKDLARASRDEGQVSLLMIDIDFFKQINDTYGHASGDLVLKDLAMLLDQSMRQGDTVCRFGGEEFLAVMVDTPLPAAVRRAEQMRIMVAVKPISIQTAAVNVTISVGVATYPQHGEQVQELIHLADLAMYQAKSQGRNQVCVAGEPLP